MSLCFHQHRTYLPSNGTSDGLLEHGNSVATNNNSLLTGAAAHQRSPECSEARRERQGPNLA